MKLPKNINKPNYIWELSVAFTASLYLFAEFSAFTWSSPGIPKLFQPDSPVPITVDESSWIVSIVKIGSIIGPIPSAWMMDRYGRKASLLAGAVPLFVGWILLGVADSVAVLYVSRFLAGLAFGAGFNALPMYLGEIASDNVRGAACTLMTVMIKLGTLYAYAVGPYVSFHTLGWLGLIPVVLFAITFAWQPESPYYYLGKNRKQDALKSLMRLRGHDDVHDELERMEVAVRKSQMNAGTYKELFFVKGNRNGLIIILGLSAVIQLCGSQTILFYAETIFNRVDSGMRGSEVTIVMGVVQLLTSLVATAVVDRIGRRPLLLFSVIGLAICNTIVGVYFNLERRDFDVIGMAWLPITAMMMYIICFTIGLACIPLVILGEIFPKNLKAIAGTVFAMNSGIIGFATIKLFQVVSDGLGNDYSFFGFAIFSFLFIPFIWCLVPETKGKSLDLILIEMNGVNTKPNKI